MSPNIVDDINSKLSASTYRCLEISNFENSNLNVPCYYYYYDPQSINGNYYTILSIDIYSDLSGTESTVFARLAAALNVRHKNKFLDCEIEKKPGKLTPRGVT